MDVYFTWIPFFNGMTTKKSFFLLFYLLILLLFSALELVTATILVCPVSEL